MNGNLSLNLLTYLNIVDDFIITNARETIVMQYLKITLQLNHFF